MMLANRVLSMLMVWLALAMIAATTVSAAAPTEGVQFFETKIRPVLVAKCYECHSAQTKNPKGNLLVDTRAGIRQGGDSGAAVVPGDTEGSLLIEALRHEGFEMPPDGKLPDEVITDFVTWIKMGAPDPREGKAVVVNKTIDLAKGREHWAFKPLRAVVPPVVKDTAWPRTPIDHFVLATLESKLLRPVADADRRTLLRRATFDLVGLPPTPQETEAFVSDSSPDAFAKVIDRLLASPQFGERWGRHWLDVARYAESSGMDRNFTYTTAWRYRDYVIDAVNSDRPYDQFVREQIAGDLLPAENLKQRNEQLLATGFLAIGPKPLDEKSHEKYYLDVVDDQIDVVGRAILGLAVSCARCHDHKFDPIPAADYYALAGIFRSTETLAGLRNGTKGRFRGSLMGLESEDAPAGPVTTELPDERITDAVMKEIVKVDEGLKAETTDEEKTKELTQKRQELLEKMAKLRFVFPPGDLAMGAYEAEKIADCPLRLRGEVNDAGDIVPRGFLQVIDSVPTTKIDPTHSGRLELAQWLTHRNNPLTARVMVNRVWYHLFGAGLVPSVDNFGLSGEKPTHPELLDALALQFMDHGWSVKQLIREIMLSRAYQMSSQHDDASYEADPDNQWLWRMSRRRLDAEAMRDAILAVSGELELDRPQGSVVARNGYGQIGRTLYAPDFRSPDVHHRSVYLPVLRGIVPDMLSLFDMANPDMVVGQRDVTTVAPQALYLMNSLFVMRNSRSAAQRVLTAALNDPERVRLAYRLALGREPDAEDEARVLQFLRDYAQSVPPSSDAKQASAVAWAAVFQTLFASAEFRYEY